MLRIRASAQDFYEDSIRYDARALQAVAEAARFLRGRGVLLVHKEHLNRIFQCNQPFNLHGFEHYSSASIGISLFRDNEIGIDNVLRHADTAMYQAKAAGRNTIRIFDPVTQAQLEIRVALEADLRKALEHNELRLYCQPKVGLASGP